jgi:hypothetical protein
MLSTAFWTHPGWVQNAVLSTRRRLEHRSRGDCPRGQSSHSSTYDQPEIQLNDLSGNGEMVGGSAILRRAWMEPAAAGRRTRASRGGKKRLEDARIKGGPSQYPERLLRSPFSGSPGFYSKKVAENQISPSYVSPFTFTRKLKVRFGCWSSLCPVSLLTSKPKVRQESTKLDISPKLDIVC